MFMSKPCSGDFNDLCSCLKCTDCWRVVWKWKKYFAIIIKHCEPITLFNCIFHYFDYNTCFNRKSDWNICTKKFKQNEPDTLIYFTIMLNLIWKYERYIFNSDIIFYWEVEWSVMNLSHLQSILNIIIPFLNKSTIRSAPMVYSS